MTKHSDTHIHNASLEPRVARLETGLEMISRDVTTLGSIVREQSHNIEGEIQKLAVSVTQAGAPRKTEWPTLIATLMLIMAIGSAVFWPLNQTAQNNKTEIHELREVVQRNLEADQFPVAFFQLKQIEGRLNKLEQNNEELNKDDREELKLLKRSIMLHQVSLGGSSPK